MGIHLMNDIFTNVTLSQPFSLRYLSYQFWFDVGDPRVDKYFLIKAGPLFTLSVIGIYLYFSIFLGPKLMANRQPLKLRGLILCYNIIMVLLNLRYLIFVIDFLDYGVGLFLFNVSRRNDTSQLALENVDIAHQLFITKFIDLLDTIFFVLRKKQQHVSVLHLYHHSSVPILYWIGFRLFPVLTPLSIFVLVNCSIHVIMYSYYALSSLGPRMRPYLWWKKYITQLQMIQFVIYGVYAIYCSIVMDGIPYYFQLLVHIQSPVFLTLFGHFYIKAYIKNKNKSIDQKTSDLQSNGNKIKINDQNNNNLRTNASLITKLANKCQ